MDPLLLNAGQALRVLGFDRYCDDEEAAKCIVEALSRRGLKVAYPFNGTDLRVTPADLREFVDHLLTTRRDVRERMKESPGEEIVWPKSRKERLNDAIASMYPGEKLGGDGTIHRDPVSAGGH